MKHLFIQKETRAKAVNARLRGWLAGGILLFLASCNFLEVDPPIDEIPSEEVFADAETARLAVSGLYTELQSTGTVGWAYLIYYPPIMADEMRYNSVSYNDLLANTYDSRNDYIPYFWEVPYTAIYQANSVIEGLSGTDALAPEEQQAGIGEARFFRAYYHFLLSNFFGDVPLIVTTDANVTSTLPRTAQSAVRDAIVDDLRFAASALAGSSNPNTRITKAAAEALLASVYLYRREWSNAVDLATTVINTSGAQLEELDKVFLRTSREAIFKMSTATWSRTNYTYQGQIHNNASARLRDELLDDFEEGDRRRDVWVNKSGNYYYSYKYKQARAATADVAEDFIFFRLAEQYLIRAEALANRAQGDDLASATADLNVIRARAGLPDLPAGLTKEALLLAVEQERRAELFMENGHRWFDLVRTGRADAVLGTTAGKQWASYKALLPIPQDQIDLNPALVQNPGYEGEN
jgi:hypothetical protein